MYDPYGGQLPEQQMSAGSIAGDLALAPLRPSTYLYGYLWPGAFSQKKGIMAPFETRGSKWKEEFSNIKNSFKSGKTKGIKSVWGSAQRLGPFGPGHRIQGTSTKVLSRYIRRQKSLLNSYDTQLSNIHSEYTKTLGNVNPNVGSVPKKANSKYAKRYAQRSEEIKSRLASLTSMEQKMTELSSAKSSTIKKIALIKPRANLLKWGIRAGKAGSLIGAGMLAWDLASAVAAPLAQLGMTALNSAANAYQSRYMPEMGGQLQLSYLSQGAATERQRSIQAISKAYINGRSAFGSEGSMMHS
jgi:hypothetical protein